MKPRRRSQQAEPPEAPALRHRAKTSKYLGVTVRNGRAFAFLHTDSRRIDLGTHPDEEAAALARDRAVLFYGLEAKLNLPRLSKRLGPAAPEEIRRQTRIVAEKATPYFGVSKGKGGFAASVTVEGERRYISTFSEALHAAIAHDRVAKALLGGTALLNFPDEPHPPASTAEMKAWSRALKGKSAPTGFRGVQYAEGRYWARVQEHGRMRTAGLWKDARSAAIARDRAVLHLGLQEELNFPREARRLGPLPLADLRRLARLPAKKETSTGYFGVCRLDKGTRYRAQISFERVHYRGGGWDTPREAAIAYDRMALHFFGDDAVLNFPKEARRLGPATPEALREESRRRYKKRTGSRYHGVYRDPSGRWDARIRHEGRMVRLGIHDREIDAARAYDAAARELHGDKATLNFGEESGPGRRVAGARSVK